MILFHYSVDVIYGAKLSFLSGWNFNKTHFRKSFLFLLTNVLQCAINNWMYFLLAPPNVRRGSGFGVGFWGVGVFCLGGWGLCVGTGVLCVGGAPHLLTKFSYNSRPFLILRLDMGLILGLLSHCWHWSSFITSIRWWYILYIRRQKESDSISLGVFSPTKRWHVTASILTKAHNPERRWQPWPGPDQMRSHVP